MDLELLSRFNAARSGRRAVVLVTPLEAGTAGRQRIVTQADDLIDNLASDPFGTEISARLLSGKSGIVEGADGSRAFLTVSVPPPRLVLIGAVHIAQALLPMAGIAGFDVTVIDPRTAFATPERFAGGRLLAEWPEDVLADVALDPYTAVAALTHDPKIDDVPLKAALEANCFYVGALGSRKTHGARRTRLLEAGVTDAAFARIDAPIGADIGAASPAEIAVAVLANVIAALRKGGERRP
jgi:xanthine dehydrogenase accessory factor